MHPMEWSDVERIVVAMDTPLCVNFSLLNTAARIAGHILDMISECPPRVSQGVFLAIFLLLGRDIVLTTARALGWVDVDDRGRVRRPKSGGAGASGDFSREKDSSRKRAEFSRKLDEYATLNR